MCKPRCVSNWGLVKLLLQLLDWCQLCVAENDSPLRRLQWIYSTGKLSGKIFILRPTFCFTSSFSFTFKRILKEFYIKVLQHLFIIKIKHPSPFQDCMVVPHLPLFSGQHSTSEWQFTAKRNEAEQ